MHTLGIVLHVLAAAAIVVLVLVQHGKGADMGAAFGSGSAGSLFGSSGAANFLSRSTGVLAAVFFVTSLGLTFLSASPSKSGGVRSRSRRTRASPLPNRRCPLPQRRRRRGTPPRSRRRSRSSEAALAAPASGNAVVLELVDTLS